MGHFFWLTRYFGHNICFHENSIELEVYIVKGWNYTNPEANPVL